MEEEKASANDRIIALLLEFDRKHPGGRLADIALRSAAHVSHLAASPSAFTAALLSPLIKAGGKLSFKEASALAGRRTAELAVQAPDALITPAACKSLWRERSQQALDALEHSPFGENVWGIAIAEHLACLSVLAEGTRFAVSARALQGLGVYGELDAYLERVARAPRYLSPALASMGERLEAALRDWQRLRLARAFPPRAGFWRLALEREADALLARKIFEGAAIAWRPSADLRRIDFANLRESLSAAEFRLLIAALRRHFGEDALNPLPEPPADAGWSGWNVPADPAAGRIPNSRFLRLLRDSRVDDPVQAIAENRPQPYFGEIGRLPPRLGEAVHAPGRPEPAAAILALLEAALKNDPEARIRYRPQAGDFPITLEASGKRLAIGRAAPDASGRALLLVKAEEGAAEKLSLEALAERLGLSVPPLPEPSELLERICALAGMPSPAARGPGLLLEEARFSPAAGKALLVMASGPELELRASEDGLRAAAALSGKDAGEVLPALLWEWIEERYADPMDAYCRTDPALARR